MDIRAYRFLLILIICICAGCANITAPTGGKKDVTPPKLVEIIPKDSLLNTKPKKIDLYFDEYVTVKDATSEVEISPILSIPPNVLGLNKKVTVKIIDSLLDSNTTYRISFGKSIRDLHEENPFKKFTYTFSTGSYFDSLKLNGSVLDAFTGLPDTSGVCALLYYYPGNDTDVIKRKPKYRIKVDNKGNFVFKGLPRRKFRLYALKETNNNLIYDGVGEKIAFNDLVVIPGDTTIKQITLRIFEEKIDTTKKSIDSAKHKNRSDSLNKKKNTDTEGIGRSRSGNSKNNKPTDTSTSYTINVDTSNIENRSFDFAHNNIKITFNKKPIVFKDKITLTCELDGVVSNVAYTVITDTSKPLVWQIKNNWKENTVYNLRLAKGFAKDSAGIDFMPAKYKFRTFEDDDYGKLKIHLPAKYLSAQYVLRVNAENDSVYQNKITDTIINLNQMKPAKYTFRIIVDKNGNGIWDTGDLLEKIQPEQVIPFTEVINLKPNWEQVIDFDQKPEQVKNTKKDTKATHK